MARSRYGRKRRVTKERARVLPGHGSGRLGKGDWEFLVVKIHKPEQRFRSIVTRRNSWQKLASRYLQKNLSAQATIIPNSSAVTEYLHENVHEVPPYDVCGR